MLRICWWSRVKRLVLRGEILGFQLRDLLFQRKGRVDNHWDSSRKEVGISPQGVAQEDLDKLVEEDCCDVAVAQINYPNLKHHTQDSIEQARGRSHEEGLVQIFMLYNMQFRGGLEVI
jgi:hypothetical protein